MTQREQITKKFREVLDASYMLKPEDFDLRDHVELKCKLDKMEHGRTSTLFPDACGYMLCMCGSMINTSLR